MGRQYGTLYLSRTDGASAVPVDMLANSGDEDDDKFAVKELLKIPPNLAYVATLPCETLMSENKRLTMH